jgi:hypothetical protein
MWGGPVVSRGVTRWLLGVVVAAAAVGMPVLVAAPAAACSCAVSTPAEQFARADAVFAGTVTGRREPAGGSSAAPAVYSVDVSRVYKGRVAASQEVVTSVSGASCGLELPPAGPALFFASAAPAGEGGPRAGRLVGSLCGGSRPGAEVPAAFGAGQAPRPAPTGTGTGTASPEAGTAAPGTAAPGTAAPDAAAPAGDGGLPSAAIIGLVVIAGAGLAAAALLRHRRRASP